MKKKRIKVGTYRFSIGTNCIIKDNGVSGTDRWDEIIREKNLVGKYLNVILEEK